MRADLERRGEYDEPHVEYELRPFPPADLANPVLYGFLGDKYVEDWRDVAEASELQDLVDWVEEGAAAKALSISLYTDGDLGVSWIFPLFIVKNFEDPLAGGFLVWRMYLKDKSPRDFGKSGGRSRGLVGDRRSIMGCSGRTYVR